MARRSITLPSQCRELKLVRQDDPVWAGEHRSPAVATLKGVDLALQAFFRRVKAGTAGTLTAAMLAIPTMAKSRTPVALLPVRPTNRMVRMVANPAQANGQIPVVSRPSTEKAPPNVECTSPSASDGGRPSAQAAAWWKTPRNQVSRMPDQPATVATAVTHWLFTAALSGAGVRPDVIG